MANTRPWCEIRETRSKLTPEQRAEIDSSVRSETAKMKLGELRKARRLSQEQIAASLGLSQGDVSKMERRTELYLSTLRRFIEAAGGELEVIAKFPDAAPIALEFLSDDVPARYGGANVKRKTGRKKAVRPAGRKRAMAGKAAGQVG
jgi:transcriptional regulator with XRE-family HTH domain